MPQTFSVKITKCYGLSLTTTNDVSAQNEAHTLHLAHKDLKALALPASLTLSPSLPNQNPLILQLYKTTRNPSNKGLAPLFTLLPMMQRMKKPAVHRKRNVINTNEPFPSQTM